MLNNLTFGSVCSGIEAASVAWIPLGLRAAWFAEIEAFPCEVLKQRFPDIPNYGDMTKLPERILSGEVQAPDILCGGTPCQAFSIAGSKESLDDPRGQLTLAFIRIADAIDTVRQAQGKPPCIIFWENVPGVLNTKDNAFEQFTNGLTNELHKRHLTWAKRNAIDYGLPQIRNRVYVIATARDICLDKVFTIPEGMRVPKAENPSKEYTTSTGVHDCIRLYDIAHHEDIVRPYTICPTLNARSGTGGNNVPLIIQHGMLRKLTPLEYERLQGFPDNWTRISWNEKPEEQCPSMVRYKALGNSWAVPVVRHIMNNLLTNIKE